MPAAAAPTQAPAAHLLGWDCIEFWVGNARTTAGFLMSAFGFRCTAYAGPETGRARQGQLRARAGRHPLRRLRRARRRLADRRPRARATATACTTSPGSSTTPTPPTTRRSPAAPQPVREPWTETDEHGDAASSPRSPTYGETVHTFVDRSRYRGPLLEPGYTDENLPPTPVGPDGRPRPRIDHVVGNVEQGQLDDWVRFYADVHGLRPAACTSTTTRSAPSTRR